MFGKVKEKFIRFIYEIDKSNEKDEGREVSDFDTWLKDFYDEVDNSSSKKRVKSAKNKNPCSSFEKTIRNISKDRQKEAYNKTKSSQSPNLEKQRELKKKLQRKYSDSLIDKSSIDDRNSDIYKKNKNKLKKRELRKAIIYSEIIAKPKSKR